MTAEARTGPDPIKVAAATTLGAVVVFSGLFSVAVFLYPGGTWCDRQASGHRFWQNFLCDLLHERSLGGASNPGAPFARAAMLALCLGFLPHWLALPALFKNARRLGAWLRTIGAVSVLGMLSVPLLPSDRFGALHGAAVLTAGGPGFVAGALAVFAVLRHGYRRLGLLGLGAFCLSLVDMAIYAQHYFAGGDCSTLLPLIQRLATGLVLGWMAAVSVVLWQSSGSPARA